MNDKHQWRPNAFDDRREVLHRPTHVVEDKGIDLAQRHAANQNGGAISGFTSEGGCPHVPGGAKLVFNDK
jgi:hypothetical protein